MAKFVLVHGAWHGGWCWEKLRPALEARGHTIAAPDLPGHGSDGADPTLVTLDDYRRRVVETVEAQGAPVILVGHSMGGIVVSAVAEAVPDDVAALVYLCAFLPRDGESLSSLEATNPRPTVSPPIERRPDGKSLSVPAEHHKRLFYGNCSDADVAWAQARHRPQPIAPFVTPVALSDARFGRVPKHYVECTGDEAISIELQRAMIAASPGVRVHTMATDHSPFLSDPEGLADVLDRIAA